MANITERENFRMMLDGKLPEWIPNYHVAVDPLTSCTVDRKVLPNGNHLDIFGVEFWFTEDGPMPTNTVDGKYIITSVLDWEKAMPKIDLKSVDWEADAKQALEKVNKKEKMTAWWFPGMWEEMHYMMSFENALSDLIEEPEATIEFVNAMADFWIEAMRNFCKYTKPDIITMFEHIANHRGLLMSPATYRKIFKPAHARLFKAIQDLGAIPQMHVDGLVENVIPDYVEIGAKMLQPFQVFNDINKYKEKYGLVAVGGWDAFGPGNQHTSTEEETRKSVRLALDSYGPGGKYVFFNSGATPRYPERLKAMDDEVKKYGTDFYKKAN
jgi:uroporphyrinogen-III decarboxylase